ncbi:hypothetical protein [Mycoplasma sp. 3686d]|uniref:hypothetical protein n=1 Tax=Mycoplasma sp. 3686d TaxID=2967300 RepID=UPI00211C02EC|nr:hypothetical protein [Mycoplasma sp. 3686d]UUM24658.1 hypothetical protein NPA12_03100 [Mycoplasma sp. 3686d]
MKKIFKIIFLNGLFMIPFSLISVSCSATSNLSQNQISNEYINSTKNIAQNIQLPSEIAKDLFDTGFLNNLVLIPNTTSNLIVLKN